MEERMTDPTQPSDPNLPADPAPLPPPLPPAPPAPSGAGAPADVGPRFVARLIDGILLGIVSSVIIVPLAFSTAAVGGFGGSMGFNFRFSGAGFLLSVISAAIAIAYFTLMESSMGQTVGKMLMGLRTEGPSGGKPTTEQALKRNGWYALSVIPFLGGLAQLAIAIYIAVTISNSANKVGWHDTFAGGTRVVKTR